MSDEIKLQRLEAGQRHPFEWGELTWFANRELGNSTELTLGRCVLKPGCGNPRHYHPNCSEILVVIQGRIRHTVAGETTAVLEAGDTVTIPPNTWHRAENVSDQESVLFIAFTSADRLTVGE